MEEPLRRLFGRDSVTYFSAIAAESCQLAFSAGLIQFDSDYSGERRHLFSFSVRVDSEIHEKNGILLTSCDKFSTHVPQRTTLSVHLHHLHRSPHWRHSSLALPQTA